MRNDRAKIRLGLVYRRVPLTIPATLSCDVSIDSLLVVAIAAIITTPSETDFHFRNQTNSPINTNFASAEERGIEFYAPVESQEPQPGSPVLRSDLTQAVPESERARLPRNPQGQLDKSCFVYVAAEDRYYCPQGQVLQFEEHKPERQHGRHVQHRIYRCEACAGCPLRALCVSTQNKGGRTINRDEFTEVRQRTVARMSTPEAKQLYNQRPRIAETTFALLKSVFGLRQFLLCGLEKVRTEWRWAVNAFNLMKLVRYVGRLRAEFAELAATTEV